MDVDTTLSDQPSADVAQSPPAARSGRAGGYLATVILVILVGILAAVSVSVFGEDSTAHMATAEDCFAIQRSIEGAALVYLNSTGTVAEHITDIDIPVASDPPECPANGTFVFRSTGPYVVCTIHGSYASSVECTS